MPKRKPYDDYDYYGSTSATTSLAVGTSSNPIVLDAPPSAPPAKKPRKKKDPSASQPEKRAARYRGALPKDILVRAQRVMDQRFFMVDRQPNGTGLGETYSVLGSTGNVYTVIIDQRPTCNCPDATKGNHCKHIIFIYLKVLHVPRSSPHWYQKALLKSELEEIFAAAPPAPASVVNDRVLEAFAKATGRAVPASSSGSSGKKRMPGSDDDCPICYENMGTTAEKELDFCIECGNALHKECFGQWARTARSKGDQVSCVFCRAAWVVAGPASANMASANVSRDGYLNLANVAGLSPERDTSSYYHGPSRGNRYYGYQEYY